MGKCLSLLLVWRYESNRQEHKHIAHLCRMEARKLQEVDHLKSTFFTNISHELRTPLTLILGQVESASSELKSPKFKNKLAMALRNSKRLLWLINQLLDLSKLEAGGKRCLPAHDSDAELIDDQKNFPTQIPHQLP